MNVIKPFVLVGGCIVDQVCPVNTFCYCPTITNRTHYYLPKLDEWHEAAEAPRARSRYGAVAHDGKLYVIGGRDATDTLIADIDVFDPLANTWSSPTTWGEAPSDFGAFVEGDGIYVAGGYDAAYTPLTSLTRLDPSTLQATPLANMSVGRGDVGTMTLQDKHGVYYHYIIGGFAYDICAPLDTVEAYDVSSDTWTSRTPVKRPRGDLAVGVIDSSMFVIAGETKAENGCDAENYIPGTSIPVSDVERFDVNDLMNQNGDGAWYYEEEIPANRFRFVAASHGAKDTIYLFGGQGGLVTPESGDPYHPIHNTTMLYVPKSVAAKNNDLNDGEVAGIVIGVLVGCGIIAAAVVIVLTYRKYRGYTSATDEPPEIASPSSQVSGAQVEVIAFDDV